VSVSDELTADTESAVRIRLEADDLEELEIDLLLRAVHRAYGVDFGSYARRSLRRRVRRRVEAEGLETISGLQDKVLRDPACLDRLLQDLSITVTSMFRDPGFYRALRARVAPVLRTYPSIRIWNAGCSTGEEAYSMAILLREHDLYDRARIYATDMNGAALARARAGAFPIERMREYTANYIAAGGTRPFSEYYSADDTQARFDPSLAENMVFARHNLTADRSFNEFNVILCRNVMIYFERELQDRVHGLLHDSLGMFGVLGLGAKESLRFTSLRHCYRQLVSDQKLYRRVA